uniref:Uncharacterized protein n=1 Tax=Oryza punctata TaxID=4537 RepID=A0A0E0LR88_ORYPU
MSGGGGGRKLAVSGGDEAEVEALLRAAQDAVMLKLQANSHLVSSLSSVTAPNLPPSLDPAAAADPLDADLARRFDALRSHRPPDPKPKQPDAPSAAAAAGAGGMDELEARFAALKGAAPAGPEKETRMRLDDLGGESDEDEDDEVDKVMRWAMDAARLDVGTAGAGKAKSAKKDDEEEEEKDEKSSSVSSDDEEEEEERLERKRKEMISKNKSKSKWFSLF